MNCRLCVQTPHIGGLFFSRAELDAIINSFYLLGINSKFGEWRLKLQQDMLSLALINFRCIKVFE